MKNVLITGASGGIGRAISERFAKEGDILYIHYYQNVESIKEFIRLYPNISIVPVQANLASDNGVNELLNQIKGPIDTFIYTSGSSLFGLLQDVTKEQFQSLMTLHLSSPFYITQQLIPKMIERKTGNIIIVSSIWGQTGAACEAAYSMVKGGQIAFVKALAKELAPSGIRVNAIAPGAIQTKMNEHFSDEEKAMISEEIPLGRFGEPKEVADVAYFLASEESSYITGQVISVNGGWHC